MNKMYFESLIKEAKEKHLWFYYSICDEWFSPDEFEKEYKKGFYYLSYMWELRDPFEEIDKMTKMRTELNEKIINFRSRIEKL